MYGLLASVSVWLSFGVGAFAADAQRIFWQGIAETAGRGISRGDRYIPHTALGFQMKLVAAEPLVHDPVAISKTGMATVGISRF